MERFFLIVIPSFESTQAFFKINFRGKIKKFPGLFNARTKPLNVSGALFLINDFRLSLPSRYPPNKTCELPD